MHPLLYIAYFVKAVSVFSDVPSKTLVGFYCPDPVGTPVDIQRGECRRPREILESNDDQQIALIHQEEESKIRGNICKISINVVRYICRICEGQRFCKKTKTDNKISFVISPQQCGLLTTARAFSYKLDLYGKTHFSSFSNIQPNDVKKDLLFGYVSNKGVCQGVHIKWDNVDYPGAMVELVFKFEFSSITLHWFPRAGLLTYNQASITYSPEGHSISDHGTIIFDKSKIDCTLSYTQRIFSKQSRLNIQGKMLDLLHFNKTEVLVIQELGHEFDVCLNQNLTILRGSMYLCRNCNLMLGQLLPEEEARISSQAIRMDTMEDLKMEILRFDLDEIDYGLCLVRNHIAYNDPSFVYDEQYSKNPSKIIFRHGQSYLIKCKKVGISLAKTSKKCFEFLPVTYKNNTYFLNPTTNVIETQSREINCNNKTLPFYKVRTNFIKPTYFCNPPAYDECEVKSETIESSRKSKYKFDVGHLFQPRHYKAKLNKILLSAKSQQQTKFQPKLGNIYTTHLSTGTLYEGPNTPLVNYNNWSNLFTLDYFQAFLQTLPDLSKISSVVVTTVIILEWSFHCYLTNSLCFVNLVFLGIFVLMPHLYLLHLYILRREDQHYLVRNRPDATTQNQHL